jgi:hypothetical protein
MVVIGEPWVSLISYLGLFCLLGLASENSITSLHSSAVGPRHTLEVIYSGPVTWGEMRQQKG